MTRMMMQKLSSKRRLRRCGPSGISTVVGGKEAAKLARCESAMARHSALLEFARARTHELPSNAMPPVKVDFLCLVSHGTSEVADSWGTKLVDTRATGTGLEVLAEYLASEAVTATGSRDI
jgi:hypothetical protein